MIKKNCIFAIMLIVNVQRCCVHVNPLKGESGSFQEFGQSDLCHYRLNDPDRDPDCNLLLQNVIYWVQSISNA